MNMDILQRLNAIEEELSGWALEKADRDIIRKVLDETIYPDELLEIQSKYDLVEQEFSIPGDENPSEIGVELEWMSPQEVISEALEAFPGKPALKKGYLPLGTCLAGSGDPYFVQHTADQNWRLVRIPHTAVSADYEEIIEDRVEFIGELSILFSSEYLV